MNYSLGKQLEKMMAKRARIRLVRICPSTLPLHTRWQWKDDSYLSPKISDHKERTLINSQVHTHFRGGWMPAKGTVASQESLYKLHLYPKPHSDRSPPPQCLEGA